MKQSAAILHYAARPAHPPQSLLAACGATLPAPRRAALAAVNDAAARVDSLLGNALALAAARSVGADRTPGALEFPAGGKPRWPDGPAFSIAHTAGLVGCAVRRDGAALGLDLELAQAVAAGDLRLVTDEDERALLALGALSPATLWTRKEAALKWAGLGLRHAARPRVARSAVSLAGVPLECVTLELPGGCIASLVSEDACGEVERVAHDALALLEAMATMPQAR